MELIGFNSTEENFNKEISGKKTNTLRKFELPDNRETILKRYMAGDIKKLKIQICKVDTRQSFIRTVKDVTFWQGWYIISW